MSVRANARSNVSAEKSVCRRAKNMESMIFLNQCKFNKKAGWTTCMEGINAYAGLFY